MEVRLCRSASSSRQPSLCALLVPFLLKEIRKGKVSLGPRFPDGASEPHPGRRGNPAPGHPEAQADPCRSARQPIRIPPAFIRVRDPGSGRWHAAPAMGPAATGPAASSLRPGRQCAIGQLPRDPKFCQRDCSVMGRSCFRTAHAQRQVLLDQDVTRPLIMPLPIDSIVV